MLVGGALIRLTLQPSTDDSVWSLLSSLSTSTIEAAALVVDPAVVSFTQVQVARHDDYSLVTLSLRPAPTPLSCCTVSPSLAARLCPRVGDVAIVLLSLSRRGRLSLAVSSPPMIMARCSMPCRYMRDAYYMPIPAVDPGSLQCEHAASRSHHPTPALILASRPCNINLDQTGADGCLA